MHRNGNPQTHSAAAPYPYRPGVVQAAGAIDNGVQRQEPINPNRTHPHPPPARGPQFAYPPIHVPGQFPAAPHAPPYPLGPVAHHPDFPGYPALIPYASPDFPLPHGGGYQGLPAFGLQFANQPIHVPGQFPATPHAFPYQFGPVAHHFDFPGYPALIPFASPDFPLPYGGGFGLQYPYFQPAHPIYYPGLYPTPQTVYPYLTGPVAFDLQYPGYPLLNYPYQQMSFGGGYFMIPQPHMWFPTAAPAQYPAYWNPTAYMFPSTPYPALPAPPGLGYGHGYHGPRPNHYFVPPRDLGRELPELDLYPPGEINRANSTTPPNTPPVLTPISELETDDETLSTGSASPSIGRFDGGFEFIGLEVGAGVEEEDGVRCLECDFIAASQQQLHMHMAMHIDFHIAGEDYEAN